MQTFFIEEDMGNKIWKNIPLTEEISGCAQCARHTILLKIKSSNQYPNLTALR